MHFNKQFYNLRLITSAIWFYKIRTLYGHSSTHEFLLKDTCYILYFRTARPISLTVALFHLLTGRCFRALSRVLLHCAIAASQLGVLLTKYLFLIYLIWCVSGGRRRSRSRSRRRHDILDDVLFESEELESGSSRDDELTNGRLAAAGSASGVIRGGDAVAATTTVDVHETPRRRPNDELSPPSSGAC